MNWFSQLLERLFPNRANKYGETRLHNAARDGDRASTLKFLELRADPNAKDKCGRTPLHMAALNGKADCVEALLSSKRINISEPDENGVQPLHLACKNGHSKIVQTLLRHGASIAATGEGGRTCMHYAAMGDGTTLMEYLLQEGQQIDERDRSGFTPLALASMERNPGAVRFLLQHGANPNILCGNGYTPLTMAVLKPDASEEVIMALIEFGADPQLGKSDQPFPNAVAAAAMLAGAAETGAGVAGMLLALKQNADPNDPSLSLHSRLLSLFAEGKRVTGKQPESTAPKPTLTAPEDTEPHPVPSQEATDTEWKCSNCDELNPATLDACLNCREPQTKKKTTAFVVSNGFAKAMEPEISEITEAEFNMLGPNVTRFSFPDECKKWFKAENGNIIAILIYDRIEKTWLGQVRIRIGNGEHQVGTWGYKMAGTPYTIFSASEAERTIKDTIKGILKGEEYNQVVDTPDGERTTTSVTGVTYRRDSGMPANRAANSEPKPTPPQKNRPAQAEVNVSTFAPPEVATPPPPLRHFYSVALIYERDLNIEAYSFEKVNGEFRFLDSNKRLVDTVLERIVVSIGDYVDGTPRTLLITGNKIEPSQNTKERWKDMINTEYTCPECKSRFVPRDQYTPEFMGRCPDCMKFITAYPPGYVAPKKVHHVNNLDRRSELIKSFESAGDTWDRARAIAIYSDLLQVPDLELCGIKRGAVLHNRAILYLKDGKLPQSYSDITESIGLAEKEPSAGSSSGLAEAYKIKVDLLSRMKACR